MVLLRQCKLLSLFENHLVGFVVDVGRLIDGRGPGSLTGLEQKGFAFGVRDVRVYFERGRVLDGH